MRILILGATGMLGHKIHETLSQGHDVTSTTRGRLEDLPVSSATFFLGGRVLEGFDATDLTALGELLGRFKPDAVINGIGVIKQKESAQDATTSIAINALFPHQLASICQPVGTRLIHFGTDCVFSGETGDYSEADPSDARDLYGRTKYLGEISGEGVLTIRSSIIGRELASFRSLVEWFLAQRRQVKGFTRATYTGLTTLEMSRLVKRLLEEHPRLDGLWQVSSRKISKYELLLLMRDSFGHDVDIVEDDTFVCDRSLNGRRFNAETHIEVPEWPMMIEALAEDGSRYERRIS